MSFFNDKISKQRITKATKEFELLKKPTTHFNKLDLVNSFSKDKKQQ